MVCLRPKLPHSHLACKPPLHPFLSDPALPLLLKPLTNTHRVVTASSPDHKPDTADPTCCLLTPQCIHCSNQVTFTCYLHSLTIACCPHVAEHNWKTHTMELVGKSLGSKEPSKGKSYILLPTHAKNCLQPAFPSRLCTVEKVTLLHHARTCADEYNGLHYPNEWTAINPHLLSSTGSHPLPALLPALLHDNTCTEKSLNSHRIVQPPAAWLQPVC